MPVSGDHIQGSAPAARKRRRWGIFLPLALLLLLAAGWSAYWFVAAGTSEKFIDAWLAREAQRGRVYACDSRGIGGFPFRIEVDCGGPSLVAGPAGRQVRYSADHLLAVAQIYDFRHLIAEIKGPVIISAADAPNQPLMRADWTLAQASAIVSLNELEQLSIAIDDAQTWISDEEGLDEAAQPLVIAKRLEAHSRLKPGGTPAARDYDVALRLRNAQLRPGADAIASSVSAIPAVDLSGTIFALPPGLTDNVQANLRAWQANGGRFALDQMRADTSAGLALASGALALTADGRLDGKLTVTVVAADTLAGAAQGDNGASLLGALGMVGRTVTVEGRQGVEIPLSIKAGAVGTGPLQMLELPPLF